MSSVIDNELLLHPELLSPESLMQIILARKIKIEGLETMRREDLIIVYNQFCLPHTQRRYKDSGRGKVLNKQQDVRTVSPRTISAPNTFNNSPIANGRMLSSKTERIKRPISFNNETSSKIIKLTGVVTNCPAVDSNNSSPTSNKRKINNDFPSPASCQPDVKKQRTKIVWPSDEANDDLIENMLSLNFIVDNSQSDTIDNG